MITEIPIEILNLKKLLTANFRNNKIKSVYSEILDLVRNGNTVVYSTSITTLT